MSEVKNKNLFLKILLLCIATTVLLLSACSTITPVVTTFKNSSGNAVKTETTYEVAIPAGGGIDYYTFSDLQSAQNKVSKYNATTLAFFPGAGPLLSGTLNPIQTVYRDQTIEDSKQKSTTQTQSTVFQRELASTGNSATQTPLPQSVCNLINGHNPCTEDKVTALTGIVSVGVIAGITTAVVSAVNNKAQQQQEQQKSKDLWNILITQQQKSGGGGQQCNPQPCPP